MSRRGSTQDRVAEWTIVETMTGKNTVVSVGGHKREWVSLRRAGFAQRVRLTANRDQPPLELERLIERCATTRKPLDAEVYSLEGRISWRLIIEPVPTAGGRCNAVQLWLAAKDVPVKPRRSIAGLVWDFERQICLQPFESTVMSGREGLWEGAEEVSLSRLLSLGERYDEFIETLQLLFASDPSQRIQTHVTVPHAYKEVMRWQVNLVAHEPGALVVWEDVTDAVPVEPPTLQQIGLHTAHLTGVNVVVIAPAHGTLAMFLTPPPEWVQHIYRSADVHVIHQDDVEAIQKAVAAERFAAAATDQPVSTDVRLLTTDGTYERVTLNLLPFPGEIGTGLVVGYFVRSTTA